MKRLPYRLSVRAATPEDAQAAVHVMRRSIAELCVADHHHDPATLNEWLANKTPEQFRTWLASPNNFGVVAEERHQVIGVGMINRSGYVSLLYRLPGIQCRGVGKAMLLALEQRARDWGLRRLTAESTITARGFYEAMGFKAAGDPRPADAQAPSRRCVKLL